MIPRLLIQLEQKHLDGLGAQSHRIFSTLAIGLFLQAHCEVKPLQQRAQGILTPEYSLEELAAWNNLVFERIKLIQARPIYSKKRREFVCKPKRLIISLIAFRILTLFSPIRIRLIIDEPHSVTNRFPFILDFFVRKMKSVQTSSRNNVFKIVVHIRQGEVLLPQFSNRKTELSEYENTLSKVLEVFSKNSISEYEVILVSSPNTFKLGNSSLADISQQKYSLSDVESRIQDGNIDFTYIAPKISQTETPNLFFASRPENFNSFEDLEILRSADVLIMSKSSFSYVGALLNPRGLIICPDFWHPRLRSWISPEDANFENRIKEILTFAE